MSATNAEDHLGRADDALGSIRTLCASAVPGSQIDTEKIGAVLDLVSNEIQAARACFKVASNDQSD